MIGIASNGQATLLVIQPIFCGKTWLTLPLPFALPGNDFRAWGVSFALSHKRRKPKFYVYLDLGLNQKVLSF